jgi:pyroglutamyl-peptidase
MGLTPILARRHFRKLLIYERAAENFRQMRCIITGFDAFDNKRSNPSELAVKRLPTRFKPAGSSTELAFQPVILPTCCRKSWQKLKRAVGNIPRKAKFVLVLSGLADGRDRITVERFGLNMRDYRIPDNSGHQPRGESVVKGGPDALMSEVDVEKLSARLNKAGLPADVSNHAGTYVCNDIYYRALHKWQKNKRCLGVVFVHLPSPELFVPVAKAVAKGKKPKPRKPFEKPAKLSAKDKKRALEEYCRVLMTVAGFVSNSK